jgi:hypothetical protein
MRVKIANKLKMILTFIVLTVFMLSSCTKSNNNEFAGYLFTYFIGNGPGEESIHYAVSEDGYNYRALNNNNPVIDSKKISTSGGVRDPHILRAEDGKTFYMVGTDLYVPSMGWSNYALILMKSTDLINWESTVIDIPETFPEEFERVSRVWAPQTIYDKEKQKYMVYWSMLEPGKRDIIYYAYANDDFTGFDTKPKQLLFKNGACIDGDIVFKDGKYHFFFKNEDDGAKGIMVAISEKINEGYEVQEGFVDQTDEAVEGSGTFKMIDSDKYILMYDVYSSGKYQFTESTDLKSFKVIDEEISMNFHPRHGSIIPITQEEMDRLFNNYVSIDELEPFVKNNPKVKTNNIVLNIKEKNLFIPVVDGTDLTSFEPGIYGLPGTIVAPQGPQDFSNGPIPYSFKINGLGSVTYHVSVQVNNNPVLTGYYADPEIIFSNKTGKFHIYPTSDGFKWWGGYYFESFSSTDLINWQNDGVILDLKKDVEWADRNAWAPCAIEKEINGKYKYFYYYTAAQKIGVAVADNPSGPFKDSGKPIVNFKPDGVNGGQEIDPDVFHDPKSGKDFLYWGNGYMAVAELDKNMTNIIKSTIKVITPDNTFREGAEVFFRKGKYYFLWSEDDTRSPNYRVRYGISDSPYEIQDIPENNLVIKKEVNAKIYGTGHNSVINVPGTDNWYIVYHRFTRPKGYYMGSAAGFNREVCIDKIEFDENGSILRTIPSIKGIQPIKPK